MPVTRRLTTADELLQLPVDGRRYELVKGEVRTMTPAGASHGAVVVKLTTRLANHVEAGRLGSVLAAETGFKLATDPDTVRAPDISFIRNERIPASGLPAGYWPGPPDLAVEVLSPDDRLFEVDEKIDDWLAAGTRSVWVVNPKRRTITMHHPGVAPRVLSERDRLEDGDIVPGFRLLVSEIFLV